MKILLLCQIIETGESAGSERHFFFCKNAVQMGHKVTAITSNVDYKNAKVKFSNSSGSVTRLVDDVSIIYVYSYANLRGSFIKRFYYYLTYFIFSAVQSVKIEKPDIIYAVSTPLTVGFLGYLISRIRGVPFVFEVSDVWPDAAVACGVVKNGVLINLAHWLEMFCYNKSVHIVGLTRGICDNIIKKGISKDKVSVITNGVDFSLFRFLENIDTRRVSLRNQLRFGDRFVAMYMGAHGVYNSLNTILDTAILLKNDPRFLFVLVGDGDEKVKLEQRVIKLCLSNVIFLKPVPRVESPVLLACADTFLLPNRKGAFFAGNLPNKVFDYLASARPIVVSGVGETPELVVAAECGMVGDAEDAEAMAKSLVKLVEMPVKDRLAMGERGRYFVLKNYDRLTLSERFLEILNMYIVPLKHR
jgi:glycosyltransferase involved in cell wall biosynthesis